MSIDCPLDCEYLSQAHEHEKLPEREPGPLVHATIKISEDFLAEREVLLVSLACALGMAAVETPGVIDADVRETLEGLVQTYLTLDRGVLYEHVPANPLAAAMFRLVQQAIAEYQAAQAENGDGPPVRDADILRILVFLRRLELERNNGRRRGRAFIAMLNLFQPPDALTSEASPLILP